MHSPTTKGSPTAPSVDEYDLKIDNAPLTQEEEETLQKMEESELLLTAQYSESPSRKKRKRPRSASPHVTPSRLRPTVPPTARALDAGYKPNNTHSFRQKVSSGAPAGTALSTDAAIAETGHRDKPSESIGPAPQQVPQQAGGVEHASGRASVAADESQRSQSIGASIPQPSIQAGAYGYPGGMGEHPVPYHQYPQMRPSTDDGRRSQSIGPSIPQTHIPPGPYGYAGGGGEHSVPYHQYPQMAPSAMQQQYVMYPGSGQPHPNNMGGVAPYFQSAGPPYANMQPPHFYAQPPFRDQTASRIKAELPTEGPNPSANVFSPHYVPSDLQQAPLGAALQTTALQTSSAALNSSTSAHSSAPTRGSSCSTPPRSTTPQDGAPQPASKAPIAEPAVASAEGPTQLPVVATALVNVPIQPMTPLATEYSGSDHNSGGENGQDALNTDAKLEDSPTVGRMSTAARQALQEGFKELDGCIKRISAATGLNPAQIVERWDVTKTRVATSWNIYQSYFEESRDRELARLDPKIHPHVGAIPNKAVISACYEAFKRAKPDTYDSILQSWNRVRLMSDGGIIPMAKRNRDFRRYKEKMDALIRHGSSHFGFESLCLTVGGVINQDQELAELSGSDATVDFFCERYRSSDSAALGQLKAHVYDRLSKRMASEDEGEGEVAPLPTTTVTAIGEIANPSLRDLKQKFFALAEPHNIVVTKGKEKSLLWKLLPQVIAEAGCVLFNWPEDVPFPCDESHPAKTASKGISVLKQPARALLYASFSHPTHPLRIEKKYTTAVPEDMPVIVGIPPDPSSPHAYGRRKFLDSNRNEDRRGPARLKAGAAANALAAATSPVKAKMAAKRSATLQKAPARTSEQKVPTLPYAEPGSGDESDCSMGLADAHTISDNEIDEAATPKALKDATQLKKAAATHKAQVQFIVPDDSDADLDTYSASEDMEAQYSGTEDDIPITRSPIRLRSKEPIKKAAKSRGSTKHAGSKRRKAPEADKDQCPGASKVSNVEVDADLAQNPSAATANKKRRVEAAAPHPTSTSPIAKPTVHAASEKSTAPSMKETNVEGRSLTDKVAQQLFGNARHTSEMSDFRPSKDVAQPSPPSHFPPSLPTATISNGPNAPQPAAAATTAHAALQHSEDHHHPPHLQAPRHEGYFPPHHPAPSSESYGGYYGPSGYPPPGWNMGPVQGWYPPGPSSTVHPSTSNAPMGGPGHPPSYWPQGPFPNPYGHYQPPNAHPIPYPQNDGSRGHGDGQPPAR